MDPVLNRKLFSDRSARRRLAEMGGIMASSPALMNEVRTFQTGGPVSDVLGRQAPAAGASFEETTARTARQLVREAQRRLASRDIEGARELLVYAAQLGSPEAQQLLSSPALGQLAPRPVAPGAEAGPAQPIGQQIGDLLRGALQPVGGAMREALQPVGELGREIGAPVGEALRETMQPIGDQMPRFVLGPDSSGVRPDISAVSQPSLPPAPAGILGSFLPGPAPGIPEPPQPMLADQTGDLQRMLGVQGLFPQDVSTAEELAAEQAFRRERDAERQRLRAEELAAREEANIAALAATGRTEEAATRAAALGPAFERRGRGAPPVTPPPSLTPETGVERFDVPVGPGLPAARPRVYDAPIGPNPARVVTDMANTFGDTGDLGAATDTALQAYGITPADNLKGRVKQYQDLFKELLGESDEDKAQEMWLNLAMVGFAIASGTSPNALENISAGLLQGSQRMAESRATRREREDRMTTFAISSAMDEAAEERQVARALEAERKQAAARAEDLAARTAAERSLQMDLLAKRHENALELAAQRAAAGGATGPVAWLATPAGENATKFVQDQTAAGIDLGTAVDSLSTFGESFPALYRAAMNDAAAAMPATGVNTDQVPTTPGTVFYDSVSQEYMIVGEDGVPVPYGG